MAKTNGVILVLKDGRLVMQRRDAGAPADANKLSLFGGHFETHETPHVALIRELGEETSLSLNSLKFKLLMRHPLHGHDNCYVYLTHIKDSHFKVFEGKGAEVYSVEELLTRNDLSPDAKKIIKAYHEGKQWH